MRQFAVALFCAVPVLASAATNLVVNGSFEAETLANATFSVRPSLTGWTSTNSIELRNNVAGTAQNGFNFVELDATMNSSISQVLKTTAGQTYDLSFYYSNRSDLALPSNGLSYTIGGKTVQVPQLAANNTGNNVWQRYSTTFLATTANTTLSFSALGTSDARGSSLDNIVVTTAVPEPEAYAMLLAGLGMLGLLQRQRRQR